jgi:hypothetical protein
VLGGQGVPGRRPTGPGAISGPSAQAVDAPANSSHAKIRCLGEQAMATLKGWRLLRKLRCSTNRINDIVKAVVVSQHAST